MSDETYYSVLEIPETASATEIKSAYLRLIREVHPDRLANAPAYWQKQAETKTKEINEAFSVLSKPAKRRQYDTQLDSYRKSQNPSSGTQTAPSSNPHSTNTSQQRSQQSTSGWNSGSSPHSSTRQQGPSTSTPPPRAASQPVSPPIGAVQRFIVASILAISGCGAASGFWNSSTGDEIIMFLLAILLFGGIAYLYRRRICPLLVRLKLSRPKQQVWVTLGIIALALLGGNIPYMKPGNILPDVLFLLVVVLLGLAYFYWDQIRLLFVRTGLSRLKYQIIIGLIGAFVILRLTAAHSNLSAHAPHLSTPAPMVTEDTKAMHADPALSIHTPTEDSSFNYPGYVGLIQSKVSQAWKTQEVDPHTAYGSQAKITFSISRDGKPSNIRVEQSSGSPSLDSSGARAVQRVKNFSPLPSGYSKSSVSVEYTFTYKLTRQAKKNSSIPKKLPVTQTAPLGEVKSVTKSEHTQKTPSPASILATAPISKSRTYGHSVISVADEASINAACTFAYSQGPASYHKCKAEQVAELAKFPTAPDLGRLSASDRASTEAACTFAYSQGPASYHRCEAEQIAGLAKHPIAPYLGGLSASDRASIEAACTFAYSQGPASYHQCETEQVAQLSKHPVAPYLGKLSASDRASVRAACTFAYSQGPASYHQCEAEQLAELAKHLSSPDLSGLSLSDRGSIQTACTFAYSQGPASYHQCLWSQLRELKKQ